MSLTNHTVQTAGERLLLAIDHYLASQEIELQGRPWRVSPGRTTDEKTPGPPWEWLYLTLESAADLLSAAYPIPIRQLLDEILERPSNDEAGRIILGRARRLLKVQWTHILDLDCNTVGNLLRTVIEGLRQDEEKEKDHIKELEQQMRAAEDSLYQRNKEQNRWGDELLDELMDKRTPPPFVFQGKKHHFSEKQGWLLYALTHDEAGNKRDEEQYDGDVIWRLWGKRIPPKTLKLWKARERDAAKTLRVRLHTLQNATNAALDKKGLPLEIKRLRNNFLRLLPKPRRKR